jgi:L-histidine Nalpha-methyltransferase
MRNVARRTPKAPTLLDLSRCEGGPKVSAPRGLSRTPGGADFASDVRSGLLATPKQLLCKYFYDAEGARLFERICTLDAYYLTRAELEIMRRDAPEMASLVGAGARIVEFGSGSGVKTRELLDHLHEPALYVPIDISRDQLVEEAARLAAEYPNLPIAPVHADYTRDIELPAGRRTPRSTVAYFPGSTIGNLTPREAVVFFERVARLYGSILIGVDLKKDPAILHAAYNDPEGVTAAFNLNLLVRIRRELGADLDVDGFHHYAFYQPQHGRIEMHLVSKRRQSARVLDVEVGFADGESILTEYSYKYSLEQFAALAAEGGLDVKRTWLDAKKLFSVQYLTAR